MASNNSIVNSVSLLLEEITHKSDWYGKVFDETIVQKWRSEFADSKEHVEGVFETCIGILRASAQGSRHQRDCNWEEDELLCGECKDKLLIELKKELLSGEEIDLEEYICDDPPDRCEHMFCKCTPPDSELDKYIVHISEKFIPSKLDKKLHHMVYDLGFGEIDWHPGSDQQVRDLIHPSLYCYVRGVSPQYQSDTCSSPFGASCSITKGDPSEAGDEATRYQWLPSDFTIEGSKVTFISYINNLHQKEYEPVLEELLSHFIPQFETVLKRKLPSECPSGSQELQVIIKVASIHLNGGEYPGGSWHIEGMPYEHIVATGIYYLDVENITPSFLEFRKPTYINEEEIDYPQSDEAYTRHHYGLEEHHEGVMNRYLGLVRALPGGCVIFPNTLQHRVKGFKQDGREGLRTIIAFFLIDPDHRIISTVDVPKQYDTMSLEDAKTYRLNLMFQRKYYVDTLNTEVYERPFSLCEH